MATFQTPKGTYDILPADWAYWSLVAQTVERVMGRYGFRRIDTPLFEATDLFARSSGESSDVVSKEMYTFDDKGRRSMTLRPEGTAPVVRAYLQHGMNKLPQPVRLFYTHMPMFRYDEVQEGRQRQFHQFGAEIIGDSSPVVDAECITLLRDIFAELGLKQITLAINSTGCTLCRSAYIQALQAYYAMHIDDICDDDRRRLETNPLRVLDCKQSKCQPVIDGAPKIIEYLCIECRHHWTELLHILAVENVEYVISHRLVRGLDYYTKTVFEFWPPREGSQSTIGGGGRYDGLAELLGGQATPGIGFASGMERVILNMREQGAPAVAESGVTVFVAYLDASGRDSALALVASLREDKIGTTMSSASRKLGDQLKRADLSGATYAIVLGPDEIARNEVMVRTLSDRTQVPVVRSAIRAWLKERA